MSRASKLTLAATGLGTAGIVYFVHWAQEADRAVSCTPVIPVITPEGSRLIGGW